MPPHRPLCPHAEEPVAFLAGLIIRMDAAMASVGAVNDGTMASFSAVNDAAGQCTVIP